MDNLIVRSTLVAAKFEGPPDPKRVAVEADVDAFLTGSLLRAADRFRLTCQLIEAPSGSVIWSRSHPRYIDLMQQAGRRRIETHAAFLAAGGEQVISVA